MALLIFGMVCNVIGLALVLGAGHFHVGDRLAHARDDDQQPEFAGSWTIAAGGFLIIIGSVIMTYELIDRFQ